jgi:hypothetical protein
MGGETEPGRKKQSTRGFAPVSGLADCMMPISLLQ